MNSISVIFSVVLFVAYSLLWKIKAKEVLNSENINVDVLKTSDAPIQKYFNGIIKFLTIAMLIIIVLQYFIVDDYLWLKTPEKLNNIQTKIAGLFLGILGLSICRLAQVTMGKSWRVGIDNNTKPGLITTGIYKYIRNPTYTGAFITIFGLILINPTFVFSLWSVIFFLSFEFQVRCKEEFLLKLYKEEFINYSKKTKRYIPFIY